MPELPEVETVKNSLKELILNKKIINVEVYYEEMIKNIDKESFIDKLRNQKFIDIKRKGKFLIFILENISLVAHLRMEGKYLIKGLEPNNKHEHIIFYLDSMETLRYVDTRKFGVIYLFETTNIEDLERIDPLKKLGIEPISGLLTKEYLKEKYRKSNKPIKASLLDQTIISGIGNIYADEVCFMCKLNPLEKVSNLDDNDLENICKNSEFVLNKAINLGGTTIRSFISSHEITGKFQNELLVHTKTYCPECKKKITKIFVTGRGTYFCENCQKLKNLEAKPLKIGLTGGIGSGKSTVLKYFKENGYKVISCDEIVHNNMKKGAEAYLKIVEKFTEDYIKANTNLQGNDLSILNNDLEIDRKKLGKIIFNNKQLKKELEGITHPLVIEEIKKINEFVIVETPLLYEANLEYLFDKILVVNVSLEKRIERIINRNNITKEEALIRINNQMPLEEKVAKADYVINNDDTIETLYDYLNNLKSNNLDLYKILSLNKK